MEFKTKYNIGDEVYFMRDGKIIEKIITGMRIRIGNMNIDYHNKIRLKTPEITYYMDGHDFYSYAFWENNLFGTKEEITKDFLARNNVLLTK